MTEQDTEKIVKHIPSNKAPGLDRVSARVLKDSLPVTLPIITNLIITSFASNCFAQVWKSAVVIPNLKSGDLDHPENTRPISLLSIMSKVCEKAANSLWTSWIKIARYPAYREEIESFTPLKPPDYTILISSFRMRMKTNICCCTT